MFILRLNLMKEVASNLNRNDKKTYSNKKVSLLATYELKQFNKTELNERN